MILHGKQRLNEAVRTAVEDNASKAGSCGAPDLGGGGCPTLVSSKHWRTGTRKLLPAAETVRCATSPKPLRPTREASLVLLPLGTANDFSRSAGIPLEPAEALELLDVPPRDIDLGEVGGQIFLNMATGGFGSQVTANTSEDLKKVLGGAAYLFTGLSRFSELHAAYGELQGPDFHWSGELLALGIGNGRQAGGGHVLCPQALADDGLLDISILPAPQELVGTLKPAQRWIRHRQMFVRTRALGRIMLPMAYINLTGATESAAFVSRRARACRSSAEDSRVDENLATSVQTEIFRYSNSTGPLLVDCRRFMLASGGSRQF